MSDSRYTIEYNERRRKQWAVDFLVGQCIANSILLTIWLTLHIWK